MASPRDDEECFAIPSGASFCGPGKTDIAQHQHQAFRGPESQQASPYNTNSYVDRDESSKDCEEDDFVSESDLATATCKGEAVVDADDDDGNVDKHHYHDGNDDDSQAFAEDSNYDDDSDDNDDVNNGRRRDDQLGTEKVASSDSEENDSDVNEHGQNDRPTRPETAFFTALSDDESSDELDENALFSRHNEELKLQAKGEAPTRPVVREVGPSRIHAERSYYDGLPFGPGPGMLFHLQPLSSKPKSSLTRKHASGAGVQNGLRRHRRDGVLHVRMPDTAVFGRQGRRVLLRFSSKAQGMVASSLEADAWEETLCKKWLAEARPVGVEHEPIVAVLKFPSWLHVEGSETRLVNAATLLGRLEQRPNICVVQRFVNPKGAKPSVYRATWRRDKLPIVVNITASRTFREASRDAHARQDADVLRHDHGQSTQNSKNQNEDSSDERLVTVPQAQHFFEERLLSEWFCPGSADTDKTTIFKVANVAVSQVHEALTRIARHLEASIGREYGLRKFAFEQLQCDLMRSKSDEWILTNVRGFELTPEAYREAHQVELEIRHRREAQGDYYDSEDEEVHNKQRRQSVNSFRLAIFLRDIVGLPGEKLDLQYRFHPWAGTVSIPVSRGTGKDSVCTVRQIRVHYFMASRVGLQQLFMQPLVVKLSRHEGVDKEEMPQSIEYHGELFLTRFLASFARHSLVNFDLRLHPSSEAASGHGEAPLLRCAIGIIRDGLHLTELDPGMPLAVDGAVLHLPPNYFDVRPLPESWISSIVAGQQQLASKSDDDGDKSMAQGTGNGQASDETSQVIQEVVAMGHAGAGASVVLDSAEAWEQAAAFFEDVQEACEGLPVSRATLIAEAMKRAKNQNHANQNLRDDAQGTSETETSTTSLLAQSAGAADAGEDELDWATIVAMLQDPRMKTFADDMQDGNLSRIARRRASECMVFTKDTFLLYLQHRAKELALQTSSLVPHEDGVEVQATEKTSECDNASAAKAWSLGLFSRRVKKDAVVRRYLRFRAYARIWACIDIDQNGRLDAAELRAYVRQRQTLEDPRAIYSKTFADWSLREMHAHLCMWLGASARANEKFERYDVDASGLISWEEFVNMADRAFRDEALDEISFSRS
ncbi:Hypothetical Protein FCC1311_044842 [Hondaea fermentalgiana]|uniref:EF-hand domain-containing protein n=1 Tax=Hondaea fermentalgiana TaxID=2315210 RepID=A0A2R5GIZ3_9STRA|nr:Hypothetical Protein FCC1311_044842 [Hondaea fermentalgiana]|eukprot:GBG28261.1 Hypothetical Protein FCC1311_044842 [Hondaea fermentalgiana]